MPDSFIISVIICTYNRCESLKCTLESASKLEATFDYEIIVVDNNSNDLTAEVVRNFQSKFNGKLKYVFQENLGLSFARNTGAKEAKGEILAFTDDDVILGKSWLLNIKRSFDNYNCCGLGGKILPIWEIEAPNWLSSNLWGALALLDLGETPKILDSIEKSFFGANFAVKKQIFQEGFNFNTKLGRSGKKLIGGEDSALFIWLLMYNKKLIYEPEVLVWHRIGREKLNKWYFIRWYFNFGKSIVYLSRSFKHSYIDTRPFAKIIVLMRQYLLSLIRWDPGKRFEIELNFIADIGKLFACFIKN